MNGNLDANAIGIKLLLEVCSYRICRLVRRFEIESGGSSEKRPVSGVSPYNETTVERTQNLAVDPMRAKCSKCSNESRPSIDVQIAVARAVLEVFERVLMWSWFVTQ